jgi:hypothetical protein
MPVFDTVAQATATVKDREEEVLQPWPALQSEVTS